MVKGMIFFCKGGEQFEKTGLSASSKDRFILGKNSLGS